MENIKDVYVINLKECKKRMSRLDANLKGMGISYKRWDAIKGKDLSDEQIKRYTSLACRTVLCNNGVIGCHLSHLMLWRHIAGFEKKAEADQDSRRKRQWYLVLEDDAALRGGFLENLGAVFKEMDSWGEGREGGDARFPEFIHLSCKLFCKMKKVTDHLWYTPVYDTTRAYMVSDEGIAKLVKMFDKVGYHVDMMLTKKQIFEGTLAYYTTDNHVLNADGYLSTISSNTFPRILVDIVIGLIDLFGLDSSYHIVFTTPTFCLNRKYNCNATFVLFLMVVGLLIYYRLYLWAAVYILIEVIYYLVRMYFEERKKARNGNDSGC